MFFCVNLTTILSYSHLYPTRTRYNNYMNNTTTQTMTQSTIDSFKQAFKPFSLENIDNVMPKIQITESPFLCNLTTEKTLLWALIGSIFNITACVLFYSSMDIDIILKFLSSITMFVFTSVLMVMLIIHLHKNRVALYFVESSDLTYDIKRQYFYNLANLSLILEQIPLSLSNLSEHQLNRLKINCQQNSVSNKEIQMIYDMLNKEHWLRKKSFIASKMQALNNKFLQKETTI